MPRYNSLTNRVIDDRGVRFRMRSLPFQSRSSFRLMRGSVLEPESNLPPVEQSVLVARRVMRWREPGPIERGVMWIVGSAFVILILLGAFLTGSVQIVVLIASVLFCFGVVIWLFYQQHTRDKIRLELLPPTCVVCTYDLSGLEPEGDGCIVCPECGAAWRLKPGR